VVENRGGGGGGGGWPINKAYRKGTDTENGTAVCWMSVSYWPCDCHSPVCAAEVTMWSQTGTWKHRTHCLRFPYKSPFANSCTRAVISNKNHYSCFTMPPDPHTIIDDQNRVDFCTFPTTCTTSPSIDKYVHIGKLRILPTDVAASNIPSSYGICFSVYIFTALGPLFPPLDCHNGIHSHLSREKPSPFRKCCGGCTVGWPKWRAESGEAWRHN